MADSTLVNYESWSPNYTKMTNKHIDTIVIHHAAGMLSVEDFGRIMSNPSRQASANYGIGTDGRIGQYVAESNRAWTTGSALIDGHAVTIECANSTLAPDWRVSGLVLRRCIDLCIDICKRNNIKRINYTGDKTGNLQMHKWWQATACPGPYLSDMFPYIADEINKGLGTTMNLGIGLNEIEYSGVRFSIIKGYGKYKQLHMMSAVGSVPERAVQDIKNYDSMNMLILGMGNCNYFEMGETGYGTHYGTEMSEGDGIHSLGNTFRDPKNGVLVFYQKKSGECGWAYGDKFYLNRQDVIFACTPYSIRFHDGKSMNVRSTNLGDKELTITKQTAYCMTADGVWHIIVSTDSCTPQVVANLMADMDAVEGFICDGGGSSQMVYIGKAYVYTGRPIPNVLALACYKEDTEIPEQDTESSKEESIEDLKKQIENLKGIIQDYQERMRKAKEILNYE